MHLLDQQPDFIINKQQKLVQGRCWLISVICHYLKESPFKTLLYKSQNIAGGKLNLIELSSFLKIQNMPKMLCRFDNYLNTSRLNNCFFIEVNKFSVENLNSPIK